ncbi:MAG TPA: NAD-binding protein [Kofleriaceae bacterium]|nr:NAD-binding protein [Kofleriaceae bacterium]
MKFLVSQLSYLLRQRHMRGNIRKLAKLLVLLGSLIAVFTALFHLLMLHVEGREFSWMTGLYWTLTVMSTLGFGDITFQSDIGRAFSIVVLLSGIFLLLIVLPFAFIRFFYAPWLEAQIRLRAPRSLPADTAGHVLLCAYDAIARDLMRMLRLAKIPHYVLEADPARASEMHADGVPVIAGDPEADETWTAVQAGSARALLANKSDTVNTNITLTVRQSAPDLEVMAIADHEESVDILGLAGANHVLALKHRLGEHLANRVNAGHAEAHEIGRFGDLVIAEFPVHNTPLANRTVRDLNLRGRVGVTVVGVWERGRFEPVRPDTLLTDSSVPVVIGTEDKLLELNAVLVIYDTNYNPALVIGGGKVGCAAVRALKRREVAVHLIEKDEASAARSSGLADRVVVGDAADRDTLLGAGLAEAPAVLLTTNDDSTNIYLAVYCRRLNPGVRIISRVTHDRNLEAIHRAGADFVLSYAALGAESAFSALQGRDVMMLGAGIELFHVPVPQRLVGKTLAQAEIGARTGLNVIAIVSGGVTVANPGADHALPEGGELLMVGQHKQRAKFFSAYG